MIAAAAVALVQRQQGPEQVWVGQSPGMHCEQLATAHAAAATFWPPGSVHESADDMMTAQ